MSSQMLFASSWINHDSLLSVACRNSHEVLAEKEIYGTEAGPIFWTNDKVKRFYISTYASTNIVSSATTNPSGLADDASEKWNLGARLGYEFWYTKRLTFSLETGATYRDYGFSQNQSTISYIAIPGTLRIRLGKGFFKINFYGSVEFNRLLETHYEYIDLDNPVNTKHNLFLHQNDAITGLYGLGLSFGKKRFKFEVFTEQISQFDTYDLQFGQTIGARTLGAALHLKLF